MKQIIVEMGTDLPDAELLSNALEPQNWSWKHAPVCLLRREQCLAIMRHQWRSLEDTEGEGYNVLGGKAMNIAIDGLKRGTTALSDAAAEAENAAMKTEDEDANRQEGHPSPRTPGRAPAPDQAALSRGFLEADLSSMDPSAAQPQPAHPMLEAGAQLPAAACVSRGILESDLASMDPPAAQPQLVRPMLEAGAQLPAASSVSRGILEADLPSMQPQPAHPMPETAGPAAAVGAVVPRSLGEGEDEEITPCHLNPNSNEGDTNDQTPNDNTAEETYEKMMTYELREQVSELAIRLWNEGVIVLPPIIWDGESGEKEKLAMERAGFLFSMYQVGNAGWLPYLSHPLYIDNPQYFPFLKFEVKDG